MDLSRIFDDIDQREAPRTRHHFIACMQKKSEVGHEGIHVWHGHPMCLSKAGSLETCCEEENTQVRLLNHSTGEGIRMSDEVIYTASSSEVSQELILLDCA
jgi:hypothetical protein